MIVGIPFEKLAEARAKAAAQRGDLSGLRGEGKPLPKDTLAGLGADDRISCLVARNCGGVPEEVALLRLRASLEEQLAACTDEAAATRLRADLTALSVRLSILFEKAGRNFAANRAIKFVPG